jgi:hypothetical protein
MQFLYSVYYELAASTYFEHSFFMFRGRYTTIGILRACFVGWLLPGLKMERTTPILVAASRHNTHAIYQVLFVQRRLKMSK